MVASKGQGKGERRWIWLQRDSKGGPVVMEQCCVLIVLVVIKKPCGYTHKSDERGTRPVDCIDIIFLVLILDIVMRHFTTGANWGKGTRALPVYFSAISCE